VRTYRCIARSSCVPRKRSLTDRRICLAGGVIPQGFVPDRRVGTPCCVAIERDITSRRVSDAGGVVKERKSTGSRVVVGCVAKKRLVTGAVLLLPFVLLKSA